MDYGYTPPAASASSSFSGAYNPIPVPGYFPPTVAGPSQTTGLVPAASSTSNGSTPLPSYFDLTPTPVYPPLTPKSLKQRLADYLQVYIRLRNEAIKRRLAV